MDDTWRRGIHHVDEEHREGIARPDRKHEFPERLNPVVGWSIVLIVSLGLLRIPGEVARESAMMSLSIPI